ncbi:MAG: hypothetical protein A2X12_01425 [Bacteroidetes bacterium GWE2_29_8]|nr:MAG: hypothetical protein A2X12_01425 [Bacteroidetes bacterium GWE2_29_8]OFY23392.1 MAG: hypothetical protein A2X02_08810 [Bacteroidetes bacterium GWF2_29_10]
MKTKLALFKSPVFLIFFIINFIFGLTFLYSGYTKLYPIEPFEYIFIENGIGNWMTSPIMARLVISFEFLLGFLIIINFKLKRITYLLTSGMLLFFTIYLAIYILLKGNEGNCGCFGQAIEMTPLESIYKNAVMLIILLLLYLFYKPVEFFKIDKWVVIYIIIISVIIPHVIKPLDIFYDYEMVKIEGNKKLNLDVLYNSKNKKNKPPTFEVRKGKVIVAFMSLTCPHCIMAANKINLLKNENPDFPIYYILNGEEKEKKPFFSKTKYSNIPYFLFFGQEFLMLTNAELPKIFLVEDCIVKYMPNYKELNETEIKNWLKK